MNKQSKFDIIILFRKYLYYKIGYSQEKPLEFDNLVDYCLKNGDAIYPLCNNIVVISVLVVQILL